MTQLWDLAEVDLQLALEIAWSGSSDESERVRSRAFRAAMSLMNLQESLDT